RGRLRNLEDRYAAGDSGLEQGLVDTSLRFGVLCRFTAYVAVDSRVVTEGGQPHRVVQPVEPASGWDMLAPASPAAPPAAAGRMRVMAMRAPAVPGRGFAMAAGASPAGAPSPSRAPSPDAAHLLRARPGRPAGPARSAVKAAASSASSVQPQLVSIREIAAVEARRLRASGRLSEYERRGGRARPARPLPPPISHP